MKMIKKLFIGGTSLVAGSLVISGILGASHAIDDALSFLPKQGIEIDTASWIAILLGLTLSALAYFVSTRTPDDKGGAPGQPGDVENDGTQEPINEKNTLKQPDAFSSSSSDALLAKPVAERNSAATDPKDADATDPKDAEREEEQKAALSPHLPPHK